MNEAAPESYQTETEKAESYHSRVVLYFFRHGKKKKSSQAKQTKKFY